MSLVKSTFPIDFHWKTFDPFLFCAHHNDQYPKANDKMGPNQSLSGRHLGQDFQPKDGFRMYHGKVIPGFPVHPHRGFETLTLVREGYVDHADSLGAAGRYGHGDMQWMTAGAGVQHSEMFPLVDKDSENPLELLQLWLNLPAKNKRVDPEYKMFWNEKIPRVQQPGFSIDVIAGSFNGTQPLAPPENSWANDAKNEVAVWLIVLNPDGEIEIPGSKAVVNRALYFFKGETIEIESTSTSVKNAFELDSTKSFTLKNTSNSSAHLLILQGKPINEAVVQYGPFVMNSPQEIQQTIEEYQNTQFGGWPWPREDMVHGFEIGRFGKHSNGKQETPS